MSKSEASSQDASLDLGYKDSSKSMKGIKPFSLLYGLVDRYIAAFQCKPDSNSAEGECLKRDERLLRIQKINTFIEQIQHAVNLQEDQKIDCLNESLQIIKKLTLNSHKYDIQTRSKRLSLASEMKAIQQVEMSASKNLTELILAKMVPTKRTLNNVCQFMTVVIEQLLECEIPEEKELNKQKTKKINKKGPRDRTFIECSLQGGGFIDLLWYLMFRVVQKNLEGIHDLHKIEKEDKGEFTLWNAYEKYVNRYIRDLVSKLIFEQFVEMNLFKDLLSTVVRAIDEIQLPILPFFLKNIHTLVQQKFKIYYTVGFDKGNPQKMTNRDIYSLQNISLFFQLAEKNANKIANFQASRIQTTVDRSCNYCGVMKINSFDRLIYQKITFQLDGKSDLAINICENCCKSVNVEASDQLNFMALAPLIMSYFQKQQYNVNTPKIKEALKGLLIYHGIPTPAKKGQKLKNLDFQINISQKIALNNEKQVPSSLIKSVYNLFIYLHSQLSVKAALISSLQILMIYWNSRDEKIREKSIKMINKSYVTSFLFGSSSKIDFEENKESTISFSHKIIKALQSRLRDNSSAVSLVTLEVLADFFTHGYIPFQTQQTFFNGICNIAMEQQKIQYTIEMIKIIERMILKFKFFPQKSDSENFILFVRCLLKAYLMTPKIIQNFQQREENQHQQLSGNVASLLQIFLNNFSSLSCKLSPSQEQACMKQFQQFFNIHCQSWKQLRNIEEVSSNMLLCLATKVKLNSHIVKDLPEINIEVIKQLVMMTDLCELNLQMGDIIQHNLSLVIDLVYQDVSHMNNEICFGTKRQSAVHHYFKNNMSIIGDFINSSSFIQFLLGEMEEVKNEDPKFSTLPNHYRLKLLNKLLDYSNLNQLLANKRQLLKYMNIWLKKKRKSMGTPLDPIFISSQSEKLLLNLYEVLSEKIKSVDLFQLELQAGLMVSIKIALNSVQQFKRSSLMVYEKYCSVFFSKYLAAKQSYCKGNEQTDYETVVKSYLTLYRCLLIATVLVTTLQTYLLSNKKMDQFYDRELSSLVDGKKQNIFSNYDPQAATQVICSSNTFNNLYFMLVAILSKSDSFVKEDKELSDLFKKFLLILRFYWQVHPKIIFAQEKLKEVLKEIDEKNEQGFLLIKSMFKLFQSLLPSQNLQLLNFIRQNFSKRFHLTLKTPFGRKDIEFIQASFDIIYYLLRSGMEGVYEHNKMMFYGILSESAQINKVTSKIIKQIYSKQASDKLIFINLMQSLECLYICLFNLSDEIPFFDLTLSQKQQSNAKLLSELTRKKLNVYLQKDKREIKMKTTFVKKIGDLLGGWIGVLKQRPTFLLMILKLLKSQQTLDYIELSEIIFCLNKMVTHYQIFIQTLLEQLKVKVQNGIQSEHFGLNTNILMTYRQLLSCLAYFSKYQEVTQQIKKYNASFDSSVSPYLQLEEVITLSALEPTFSIEKKLQTVEKDINVFLDITLGEVEYVSARLNNTGQESSKDSRETVLTRDKGSRKTKQNPKKQKNYPSFSVSLEKPSNETFIQPELEAGTLKARLRRQERKNYRTLLYEC